MISKSLKARIAKANRYIAWAKENAISGTGDFWSTRPVSIEYTHPITLSRNGVVTVRYKDHARSDKAATVGKYDIANNGEAEDDLRYEMKTYIVKAIKNGADEEGVQVPSFKS